MRTVRASQTSIHSGSSAGGEGSYQSLGFGGTRADEDALTAFDVVDRVVTMHASDRYLTEGTLDDLRREEGGATGYAKRLSHGEIGKGLNDYDAIFGSLAEVGFDGWVSIEDGMNGMEEMKESIEFLKTMREKYFA